MRPGSRDVHTNREEVPFFHDHLTLLGRSGSDGSFTPAAHRQQRPPRQMGMLTEPLLAAANSPSGLDRRALAAIPFS
jgi:hypothetical protein